MKANHTESAFENADPKVKSPANGESKKASPIGESKNAEAAKSLNRCEETIRQNEKSGIIIGQNLSQINKDELYKTAGFKSFDIYCRERWRISGSHAHRLIKAAECYDVLVSHKTEEKWDLPRNEAQIRPLTQCDEHEWVDKWGQILKKFSGKSFTAEDIDEFLFPDEEPVEKETGAASGAKTSAHKAESREAKRYKTALEKIERLVTHTLDKKTNDDAIPIIKFRKFLERIKKLIGGNN